MYKYCTRRKKRIIQRREHKKDCWEREIQDIPNKGETDSKFIYIYNNNIQYKSVRKKIIIIHIYLGLEFMFHNELNRGGKGIVITIRNTRIRLNVKYLCCLK